jgi:hypothetical protein
MDHLKPTDAELNERANTLAEARYSLALAEPELVHMARIQVAACQKATLRHLQDIRIAYPMLKAYRHAMVLVDATDFTAIDSMIEHYRNFLGLPPEDIKN